MSVYKLYECDWCGDEQRLTATSRTESIDEPPRGWRVVDDQLLCVSCLRARYDALLEVKKKRREIVRNGSSDLFADHLASENDRMVVSEESDHISKLHIALAPLVAIADAYDSNNLDDEARKFYGLDQERRVRTDDTPCEAPPVDQIELYSGRGGKQLLTLAHCLYAREVARR